MKIERFSYFVQVARLSSITAAARQCYITQTAMSQQMDAIERDLGVKLLKRTRAGTTLTEAGRRLLPKAERLLACYQDILDDIAGMKQEMRSLVIAYTGPMEQQLLLKAIPCFNQEHPRVVVQVRQLKMTAIASALENGECDLALAIPGEVAQKDYQRLTVMQRPLCVALSENHPLAKRKALSLADLAGNGIVLLRPENSANARGEIRFWLCDNGLQGENLLFADTIEDQLLMVNLNQGITFVPEGSYPTGICLVPLIEGTKHRTEAVVKRMTPLCRSMIRALLQAAKAF